MGWICAQTETNRERMARRHLQAAGYSEIYLPEIREQRRQRGKPYSVIAPLLELETVATPLANVIVEVAVGRTDTSVPAGVVPGSGGGGVTTGVTVTVNE